MARVLVATALATHPHPIPGGGGSVDNYPLMQPWTDTPPQNGDLNRDDQITPADALVILQVAEVHT